MNGRLIRVISLTAGGVVDLRRTRWLIGAAALAITAGVPLAACASSAPTTAGASCGGSAPKLTVQGSGVADATPDLLTLVAGVDVTDPTAAAALSDNNSRATAVIGALRQAGIADRDIQTTGLTIQPQYGLVHGTMTLTGYQVTNTVTAKLHDLMNAGRTIDDMGTVAGDAARIDSLSFSVDDTTALDTSSRTGAVRQAVSRARAMATAAGKRLGPLCSVTDDTSTVTGSPFLRGGASGQAALPAAVPLEPGSQTSTAQVTLVYGLS